VVTIDEMKRVEITDSFSINQFDVEKESWSDEIDV
jgi:hypothetical protein